VLIVIGPRWLSTTDSAGGRRLDDPNDLVRLEVEAALSGMHRVFPLTVEGAEMPRAAELPGSLAKLTRRNAIDLSEKHWHQDVSDLISAIERAAPNLATRRDEARPAARALATDTNAVQLTSPSRTQPAPGTPRKAPAVPQKAPGNLRAPLVMRATG